MNLNNKKEYTLKEILRSIEGTFKGLFSKTHIFTGISTIEDNKADKITFAEDKNNIQKAEKEAEGLVIVGIDDESSIKNKLEVENVRLTYAKIAELFNPLPYYNPGVASTAVIEDNVKIGKGISINHNTYIGENTEINDNVIIGPGVTIGKNVKIGSNTIIHPNVVIERDTIIGKDVTIEASSAIGSEGYGYVTVKGQHHHIPQLGNVIIEDEVEIGASVTIDRATQSSTIIGKGTKIDNQVQIGHNVEIGKNCLIIAHVGIGGSTTIGDNVILAGRVGVIDHAVIGDNVVVGAASVVTSDIPEGKFYLGNPAQDKMKEMRMRAVRNRLPEYSKLLKKLKQNEETDK